MPTLSAPVGELEPEVLPATFEEALVYPGLLTAEQFFFLRGEGRFELIHGRVVDKDDNNMSGPAARHGKIAVRLARWLEEWAHKNAMGDVYAETGFALRRGLVRRPDVFFLAAQHLPEDGTPDSFIDGPPTLAVEIVSPNDLWTEVEDKARLYLEHGTRVVWIVEPNSKIVQVRASDAVKTVYRLDDILDGGEVLPGFQLPLREIFE